MQWPEGGTTNSLICITFALRCMTSLTLLASAVCFVKWKLVPARRKPGEAASEVATAACSTASSPTLLVSSCSLLASAEKADAFLEAPRIRTLATIKALLLRSALVVGTRALLSTL